MIETIRLILSSAELSHPRKSVSLNHKQFQARYRKHTTSVDRLLARLLRPRTPVSVYEPIRYVIAAGGKRLRAALVLLSCEAVGGNARQALHAAAAVELLHNFTLVHDDVMDHADVRRGRPTIHKRWDANTAILAGDEMTACAYDALLRTTSPRLPELMRVFTRAFIDVCEGQGLDKEFETRAAVSMREYVEMIRKKTACIIGASAEIGAIIGNATGRQQSALRRYGEQLGLGFQIQDDLLDIIGSLDEFGKPIGGDIVERKKTFLFLTALDRGTASERTLLRTGTPPGRKRPAHIRRIKALYEKRGVIEASHREIVRRTLRAQDALEPLPPTAARDTLVHLADQLKVRTR